ncbi:rRNA maturation RNase YbeY [bacterium]|jgi:probable rRNA maturation factor|nr:rRNA maturation RNase YbeY [bacterium]NBX48836.1 rRNA maturation RNase YbeY [bacterium]
MITFDVAQDLLPKKWRFSRQFLLRVTKAFADALPEAKGEVHVHVVNEAEIRRLNRMHRGKDKITDVLSFPAGDLPIFGALGDVLICFEQAERQAEGDISLELTDLLVHGILHVLGYDHEMPADAEVMFPLQDKIVGEVLRTV